MPTREFSRPGRNLKVPDAAGAQKELIPLGSLLLIARAFGIPITLGFERDFGAQLFAPGRIW